MKHCRQARGHMVMRHLKALAIPADRHSGDYGLQCPIEGAHTNIKYIKHFTWNQNINKCCLIGFCKLSSINFCLCRHSSGIGQLRSRCSGRLPYDCGNRCTKTRSVSLTLFAFLSYWQFWLVYQWFNSWYICMFMIKSFHYRGQRE